ncbi:hypothetical protein E8E12_000888 [Didymella heteroderae]|uniref:Cytochrome P450 n=1 Tax=Didymella heteroderae TaxID=1769908 RepID=A0A9P4WFY6_9PLEO|nr:hypothetical protein E8E12_000888 [Didymella heteroderae]
MKSGQLHQQLKEFHSAYGPVVRIAPDELSYADERAWEDIYRKRTFFRNKTWFMRSSADEPHSIFTYREDYHARFKKAFAPGFLDRSLQQQAPVVEAYTDSFIKQMRAFSCKSVDMTRWFNYYTFDLAGDLLFGESFGCLEQEKEHEWVRTAQDFGKSAALIAVLNFYWPLSVLFRYFLPRETLRRAKMHRQMSDERAQRRLGCKTDRADFVASAMAKGSGDRSGSIRDDEWAVNMAVFVVAASETTSSALTAILRELLTHPRILDETTREVRKAFSSEEDISMRPASKLNGLQQLDAVVREGLRLNPPVAIGVPRVTPEGGETVCGKWVPGGTYVTYNQYPANRQEYNFSNANGFDPGRFLRQDPRDKIKSLQPFIVGRHDCIGRKFANAQMRLVLARLLWAFDMRLADPKAQWDWGKQNTYVLWDKQPLNVIMTLAPQTTHVS